MISHSCISEVTGLSFSPDGAFVAAACGRSMVRIYDLATSRQSMALTTPFQIITSICYSPDGQYLAVGGVTTPGGPVQWWRLADPTRPMRSDPHDLRCKGIAFSADSQHLYSLSYSAAFRHRLNDTSTDRRHLENGIHAMAVDRSGQPFLLFDSGAVVRFDAELGRPHCVVTVPAPEGPNSYLHQIGILPDRHGIAVATGRHLAIWDGPPSRTPRVVPVPAGPILKLAVLPDSSRILTGGPDGYIRVWDTSTLQMVRQYDWQIGDILSLAISGDGMTAAAGGARKNGYLGLGGIIAIPNSRKTTQQNN